MDETENQKEIAQLKQQISYLEDAVKAKEWHISNIEEEMRDKLFKTVTGWTIFIAAFVVLSSHVGDFEGLEVTISTIILIFCSIILYCFNRCEEDTLIGKIIAWYKGIYGFVAALAFLCLVFANVGVGRQGGYEDGYIYGYMDVVQYLPEAYYAGGAEMRSIIGENWYDYLYIANPGPDEYLDFDIPKNIELWGFENWIDENEIALWKSY